MESTFSRELFSWIHGECMNKCAGSERRGTTFLDKDRAQPMAENHTAFCLIGVLTGGTMTWILNAGRILSNITMPADIYSVGKQVGWHGLAQPPFHSPLRRSKLVVLRHSCKRLSDRLWVGYFRRWAISLTRFSGLLISSFCSILFWLMLEYLRVNVLL